jgi:putative glutamine amidotransferase
VADAGGLPVGLPHRADLAEASVAELDGLLVAGGAFDIDPSLFGATSVHPAVTLKPGRTAFEQAALRCALARRLPVLGICGGMQLLAVAAGGTLHQHIPDDVPGAGIHEGRALEPAHEITTADGSALRALYGVRAVVNSTHHQAVDDPGTLRITARAPDGVVEGIEAAHDPSGQRSPFLVGVQWHPEYRLTPGDEGLFEAFVAAAGATRAARRRRQA